MIEVQLPYGNERRTVSLPSNQVAGILSPGKIEPETPAANQRDIVEQALRSPVQSPPLAELARGRREVVIITSDHTRPVPSRLTMPLLLREIRSGSPTARIKILIATGFHRPTTTEELAAKLGRNIVENEEIVVHDCRQEQQLKHLGTLPSGGKLVVNRLACEADLLVSEGFVEPHFFAGYSGGRKSILPGIAGRETVLGNHCAEFIAHSRARTGILDGNPLHEDMVWAAEQVGLEFVLNLLLDKEKAVAAATAGHWRRSHLQTCRRLEQEAAVAPAPADIVITSNGGYPLDQNIYQTVKCMTAAEATCREGGIIIAAAECRDGHGGEGFYRLLAEASSPAEVHDQLRCRERDQTLPDQWEAQILARILKKHTVIMVTDAPRSLVEDMHMLWAEDLPSALSLACRHLKTGTPAITVVPDGVGVIIKE